MQKLIVFFFALVLLGAAGSVSAEERVAPPPVRPAPSPVKEAGCKAEKCGNVFVNFWVHTVGGTLGRTFKGCASKTCEKMR